MRRNNVREVGRMGHQLRMRRLLGGLVYRSRRLLSWLRGYALGCVGPAIASLGAMAWCGPADPTGWLSVHNVLPESVTVVVYSARLGDTVPPVRPFAEVTLAPGETRRTSVRFGSMHLMDTLSSSQDRFPFLSVRTSRRMLWTSPIWQGWWAPHSFVVDIGERPPPARP
jgi:hypothetical protein